MEFSSIWRYRKPSASGAPKQDNIDPGTTQDSRVARPSKIAVYEFPEERLRLLHKLGEGEFGVVMQATATGIIAKKVKTTVAVKMVRKQTDNNVWRSLLWELRILSGIGQHLNVVNLLGAVTKNIAKRELMVIVEYCRFGNLHDFLLKNRPQFIDQINMETGEIDSSILQKRMDNHFVSETSSSSSYIQPHSMPQSSTQTFNTTTDNGRDINIETENATSRVITTTDLVCWAAQVACGMEYLASGEILHGDLAARNVLLCEHNVVKICDFGLARSMYKLDKYKKKGKEALPFKWLALECIKDNVFSTHSDVWAYGIMLWEFFSLGKLPYQELQLNHEFYIKLKEGHRMKKPDYATDGIYDIMLRCWKETPKKRPSFQQLKREFYAMLPEITQNHYSELNERYVRLNGANQKQKESHYFVDLNFEEQLSPTAPDSENGVIV